MDSRAVSIPLARPRRMLCAFPASVEASSFVPGELPTRNKVGSITGRLRATGWWACHDTDVAGRDGSTTLPGRWKASRGWSASHLRDGDTSANRHRPSRPLADLTVETGLRPPFDPWPGRYKSPASPPDSIALPPTPSATNHSSPIESPTDKPTAMAMSDTGSSLADWSDDLYHYAPSPGLSLGAAMDGHGGAAVLASAANAATPTSPGSGDGSPTSAAAGTGILGPRAAGKPSAARKRARASRRAPVTMLNTDAANFRAMVQQFTGIPAPPAGPVINFGVPDYGFHHQPLMQPAAAASVSFDHQRQQYAGGAFDYGMQQSLAGGHGGVFGHGLGAVEDRMLLQSLQAAQMPGAHTANNGAHGYFA
uniref:Uncharacterized protein n=1 Tax=Avena sativa TaxID=4498 RepID=A0ACD5ZGG4_AVESA